MKKIARRAIAAVAIVSTTVLQPTQAGGTAGLATEFTQLANNAELIAIYAENVAQLQKLIEQYRNMLQNTASIPGQWWPSIMVQISDLVDAVEAVDGAANASINAISKFQTQYQHSGIGIYGQDIQKWRTGFRNQVAEALRQAGVNATAMKSTHDALREIQAASQSAIGRMQVLQAANQISGLMVNELTSLHQTIIAAEQARLNYMQTETEEKNQRERMMREFFKDSGRRYF